MRAAVWMTLGLLIACWVSAPARAQPSEVDVIVGRADADASGAWPVMLWVRDGAQSRVIVRAPRAWLGAMPWRAADAQALMQLERFGAPRLQRRRDADPCSTALAWARVIHPPGSAHWPGEREALAHPVCATGGCEGEAWQLALPEEAGDALPLAKLLPGLGADRAQWLVLLVVSPSQAVMLEGLPQLRIPASLQWDRPIERWASDVFPERAAASFPAIHTALLEQLAATQGLASSSALMRSDSISHVQPHRYVRSWEPSPEQRQALGLAGQALQGHNIFRLLLRLNPGSRPTALRLQAVDWREIGFFGQFHALEPQAVDRPACRLKLADMNCKQSCAERLASLPGQLKWGFLADASIKTLADGERPAACLKSCEQQRAALDAGMESRFEAVAQRQRDAWRWVEELTGRPAGSWQ